MSTKATPQTTDHPALTAAKRAIRRGVPTLTAAQVYLVAALVETLLSGQDCAGWELSYAAATAAPYHWTCDELRVKGGA